MKRIMCKLYNDVLIPLIPEWPGSAGYFIIYFSKPCLDILHNACYGRSTTGCVDNHMDVIVHDAEGYELKVIFFFCSVQYVYKAGFEVLLLHHIPPLDTAAHDVIGMLGQLYTQFPCHWYSSVFLL
jgi:hypothetical protein